MDGVRTRRRDRELAGICCPDVRRQGWADAAYRRSAMVGRLLPSKFQGVKFNSVGDPVLHINTPPGISADLQKRSIEAINRA